MKMTNTMKTALFAVEKESLLVRFLNLIEYNPTINCKRSKKFVGFLKVYSTTSSYSFI